jgi:hypothetical protein
LPKSYELLDNVAQVVNDHNEIPLIFIQGHTDSDGNDAYNLTLSDRRAQSVMRYLTTAGKVEIARLKAKGFGETKPIADNKSEAGKQQNRRVEFLIGDGEDMSGKEMKAKPDDEAEADDEDGTQPGTKPETKPASKPTTKPKRAIDVEDEEDEDEDELP